MAKKEGSRTIRMLTRLVNIRYWGDFDRTKSMTKYVIDLFKKFFFPQKAPVNTETFKQAKSRLKLTESQLQNQQRGLLRSSIIMFVVAWLLLIYSLYHLINGHFIASILSLLVVCLALSFSFRYHFWYFQLKKRKLGCSVREWYREGLLGKKA